MANFSGPHRTTCIQRATLFRESHPCYSELFLNEYSYKLTFDVPDAFVTIYCIFYFLNYICGSESLCKRSYTMHFHLIFSSFKSSFPILWIEEMVYIVPSWASHCKSFKLIRLISMS